MASSFAAPCSPHSWFPHSREAPSPTRWASGKSHVRIAPCDDDRNELGGKIVWLREPLYEDGSPKLHRHNDNWSLRRRPLMGIKLLTDLEDEGGGEWDDGEIYNPQDGETYEAELEVVDRNTLKVRGCVFINCKTQIWKLVEQSRSRPPDTAPGISSTVESRISHFTMTSSDRRSEPVAPPAY